MHEILICSIIPFLAYPASASTQQPISLENWANHPEVKEVRALYDEVNSRIKSRKYITKVRRFNVESELCATYPIEAEMLTTDAMDRVWKYQIRQIGSHREAFIVERYYDLNGKLRFVYIDRVISNVRIYLNREGKVFWAVEASDNKITKYESEDEDWENKPVRATEAKEEFQKQQLCPEIRK